MITEIELRVVKRVLQLVCKFGVVDLDFSDNNVHPLQISKSNWKRRLLFVRTMSSLLFLIFSFLRIPKTLEIIHSTKRLDSAVIHGVVLIYRTALFVTHLMTIQHLNVIAELLNNALSLNKQFGLLHFNREYLEPNLREKIFCVSVFGIMTSSVFCAGIYLTNPNFPVYAFSALSFQWRGRPGYYLYFLAIEVWPILDVLALLITYFLIEFVFIFSSNFWLTYLCERNPRTKTGESIEEEFHQTQGKEDVQIIDAKLTMKTEEKLENSIKLYRQIYILNTLQGLTLGNTLVPLMKLGAGLMSMLTFYACVKLGKFLHIFTYIFALNAIPAAYVILLPVTYAMSGIYNKSSKFQSVMLNTYFDPCKQFKNEDRSFVRAVWSCAIIRCRVGSMYWMEKDAKATLIQWLVSGTTYLLLTFK